MGDFAIECCGCCIVVVVRARCTMASARLFGFELVIFSSLLVISLDSNSSEDLGAGDGVFCACDRNNDAGDRYEDALCPFNSLPSRSYDLSVTKWVTSFARKNSMDFTVSAKSSYIMTKTERNDQF